MKLYRKKDQEYADAYDRHTIKMLKKLERDSPKQMLYNKGMEQPSSEIMHGNLYNPFHEFHRMAVHRAQNREESIRKEIMEDENKDRLVNRIPVPKNIRCKTCSVEMTLETHFFDEPGVDILFVFSCPNHSPKRVMYPNGIREKIYQASRCNKCGGELSTKTEEGEYHLKFVDTCIDCGHQEVLEYEMEPEVPLTDADIKKYCTYWAGRNSFEQDLEKVGQLAKKILGAEEEKRIKEEFKVDKIEKLKVPQLEQRLTGISEGLGFIKFKFESIASSGPMIVSFSVQDPTDRDEKESIKIMTKAIKETVFQTNWRLTYDGLSEALTKYF